MRFALTAAFVAAVAASAHAAVPTLDKDWSALVVQSLHVLGGDFYEVQGVGIGCPYKAAGGCKVQMETQAAYQYFDYTNNRTAMKGPTGQGIVTLYNLGKEFQVDAKGNCQAYCNLLFRDREIEPLVIDPKSKDLGSRNYNGQTVEVYENVEPLLETEDWYVVTSDGVTTPVCDWQHIYFLDQINATSNMTFMNYKAGAPPANQFTVNGMASCPLGNNCPKSDDDAPPSELSAEDIDVSSVSPRHLLAQLRSSSSSAEIHRLSPLVYDTFWAEHFDE